METLKNRDANRSDKDYVDYAKLLTLLEQVKSDGAIDEGQYRSIKKEIMKTYHVQSDFFLQWHGNNNNLGGRA